MNTSPSTSPVPCPSRLALAELDAHPESASPAAASLGAHASTCARCRSVLGELAQARAELLGGDPDAASRWAARSLLGRVEERRAARRRRWLTWLPATLVPAAAALALFALSDRSQRAELALVPAGDPGGRTTTRAKSAALALRVYCKRGQTQFELDPTASEPPDLLAGDRLRFAYSKDVPGFLTVFSVDDQGRVFPYYRDDELGSQPAEAGQAVMLPGSVELDAHHGWERLFAVWSEQPLSDDAVRAAVARGLAEGGGDVRVLKTLPIGGDQVSYLLRRP